MKKIAVYSGSFDPPTNGHAWVIQTACEIFDEVIVAIGTNPGKKYMFTTEERIDMVNGLFLRSIGGEKRNIVKNIQVESFELEYLMDFADKVNANYIVRGIRSETDYKFEREMMDINHELFGTTIDTIFLMPPKDLQSVSSSMIKGLIGYNGWELKIQKFVTPNVKEAIIKKVSA